MGTNLNTATEVPVNLGERSYKIVIAPEAIDEVASVVSKAVATSHLVVVSDSNVAPIYLDQITQQLAGQFERVDNIVVPAGEPSKSVAQLDQLLSLIHI